MRLKIAVLLICLLFMPAAALGALTPSQIVAKLDQNFSKLKDATADLTLEYNIHLFGCSGVHRMAGQAYFKYPDKIKAILDDVTYFARGNKMRKIESDGKKLYVKLLNAIDFSVGFNPKLITHNFYLSVVQEDKEQLVLLGIPKPGTLKNVKKIFFHFDRQEYLLRKLDVKFVNKRLRGQIKIDYQKIKDTWVPAGFHGESAIVFPGNVLVGMSLKLKGENIKINTDLPDKLFDPGF